LACAGTEGKKNFAFIAVIYPPNRKSSGGRKALPQHLVAAVRHEYKIM
jgi:hypothetical protein